MNTAVQRLTERLSRNPPASDGEVARFLSDIRIPTPPGYIDFMRESNGAEGAVGDFDGYLVLWPLCEIARVNAEYGIPEFAPHLLLFGSNGAGDAYAFDARTSPTEIVAVSFIGLDDERPLGTEFEPFLQRLSESKKG